MKNPTKKRMFTICSMLLLQSATTMHGMGSVKRAYQTARSKVSDRWQVIKGDIGKLQDALACINTNSCTSEQQAYIKSLVKKVALGVAAAMAACGIYSVVRSKQYESLKEDVGRARTIAAAYRITRAEGIGFIGDMKRYLDALRAGEEGIAADVVYYH